MNELRPILKEVEQDSINMNRFFTIIKNTKIGDETILDKMFTEWGKGYINSLCSNNSRLSIVPEKDYLILKKKYEKLKNKKQNFIISFINKRFLK